MRLLVLMLPLLCAGCDREEEEIPRAVAVNEDGLMEVKLMTFNLRYENGRDIGVQAWRERVVGIVRMLRQERPDVLSVQEGLHGQIADLRVSLPGYSFAGKGREDGLRKGEYTGIFFRSDRFEADSENSGMIWLSATPDKAGSRTWGNEIPRVATWVRLIDRASARALWAVNMHLDHKNQPSREEGVRLVAAKLVEMNRGNEPVVWMGDFNATEQNPAVRFITGKGSTLGEVKGYEGMTETYDELHRGETKRGTLHFWMSDPNRQWKVDHIFISKEGEVLETRILRTGEPYLSDHFPVMARVRFPDPAR